MPPEFVATFLFEIRRHRLRAKIGAAVNDRRRIVILLPEGIELSMREATELQITIREAVQEAGLRSF